MSAHKHWSSTKIATPVFGVIHAVVPTTFTTTFFNKTRLLLRVNLISTVY